MMECVALVVAAGRGSRFDAPDSRAPKQYLPLAGTPVLAHSTRTFAHHPGVDAVRVVIHPSDRGLYDQATVGLPLLDPVNGGPTRQTSVRLGLESLADAAPRFVLIHDAARPLVSATMITRTLDALHNHPGAVPVIALADSLKRVRAGIVADSIAREGLFRVQTPQGFRFNEILAAHRAIADRDGTEFTDDVAVAATAGIAVATVDGDETNLKITTAKDLALASRFLQGGMEFRTGSGFDIHAFDSAKSGPVRLCGIDIAHPAGLVGHSDADSAFHAITDALFGAIGAGDIGEHFPPSDPRWKGADSALFLKAAAARVRAAGGRLVNIDVTILCEKPKIAPHREAMRARTAEILMIPPDRVGIKATTTERLGAIGRGEGVAAQAIATVALPLGDTAL